eukprot:974905-Pleurochrysis_carterae.AAC.2
MRAQAAAQIRVKRRTRLETPKFRGALPLSDRARRAEGPVANDCISSRLQRDVRWLAEALRLMHWALRAVPFCAAPRVCHLLASRSFLSPMAARAVLFHTALRDRHWLLLPWLPSSIAPRAVLVSTTPRAVPLSTAPRA